MCLTAMARLVVGILLVCPRLGESEKEPSSLPLAISHYLGADAGVSKLGAGGKPLLTLGDRPNGYMSYLVMI